VGVRADELHLREREPAQVDRHGLGLQPDDDEATAGQKGVDGLVEDGARARHLVHDAREHVSLGERLGERHARLGQERLAGAERARELEPVGSHVDDRDARAGARGRVRQERADAARAQHDDVLARDRPAPPQRVRGDRHRLRERRHLLVEAVRLDVEAGRRRHGAELREPAVAMQPDGRVAQAQVREPGAALEALAAGDPRAGGDDGSGLEPGDARPDRDDAAGELVAGDHRAAVPRDRMAVHGVRDRAVHPLADVGAADPGRVDLEQELARARRRLGNLLDPDVAGPVVDSRLHRSDELDGRLRPRRPSGSARRPPGG
jgi:hypothetical protein